MPDPQTINKIAAKQSKLAIGLISGTSMDGIDAALVEINGQGPKTEIHLEHFLTVPYPEQIRQRILEVSTPGKGSVDEICLLNVVLGELFAAAVQKLLREANSEATAIDFLGSHGQTVQHLPDETAYCDYLIRATLQLGEPAVIAKRTGILTVADFRPADMALSGQGAPLVPYFDYVMFTAVSTNRALLNIGGIANVTLLKANTSVQDVTAFDTGPGNMLIDYLMDKLYSKPFDDGGVTASSGDVCDELLTWALRSPFFKKAPPKSTGREEFGLRFGEAFMTKGLGMQLGHADLVTTASELTVQAWWQSCPNGRFQDTTIDELIVSGGGTRNSYIMNRLRSNSFGTKVTAIDDLGIPSEAKEAICFAVLANETLCGNANNVPGATGALQETILGKVCF